MKSEQYELVKKSWSIIAKIDFELVGGAFYFRLFEIAPELKPMFKTHAMKEQSVKLGCMLSYVITKFDSMESIIAEVKLLAQRHTKYGVKNEHYQVVGDALLWTLEQGLAEYWNPGLQDAWKAFYHSLSTEMMAAQQEAL